MTEDQLTALLRLKRYEQPPPGYFDDLLRGVHRRQREELLRRPLWKIALERWQTFFGEHSMGPLSYASAMASILLLGIAGVSMLESAGVKHQAGAVALSEPTPPPAAPATPVEIPGGSGLRLARVPTRPLLNQIPVSHSQSAPRYVIDTRPPASHEQTFSF